ncbi:MAG TPA: VOC family protein [Oceanicaulis sp.]|mgnify:CR=1 FL=1|jgi:PhnB protein|uniref:Glyoxalase n=1 Tax=Glycocaulis albus TaxID=1382801 RepID=A0ABQ1XDU1_9PROT|nr:glyoxalase/bleomycin resistance/extradiol dioxygenase family protein [Glycocaulis albus]GGG91673.1 glyoxalase [Glycocaulis albus]HCY54866.1 VOC family protein [Oceanicaulis sp.]
MADLTTSITNPETTKGVIPYLDMGGKALEAAAFYEKAFDAKIIGHVPGQSAGRVAHCQIEINGGTLMMTDHRDAAAEREGFHLQIVAGDAQARWDRAVEAGCEIVMPFEMQFWGDRWGLVRDPFGIQWAFNEAEGCGA